VESPDRTRYVLRARFERDNRLLHEPEEIDGTFLGIDCSDGAFNYCIAP
jgi:hypothetical protein